MSSRPFIQNKRLFVLCCVVGLGALIAGGTAFKFNRAVSAPKSSNEIPTEPSGEALAQCLDFSAPVQFKVEKLNQSLASKSAKPIWSYYYFAPTQTAATYTVELHPARSLFGAGRGSFETMVAAAQKTSLSRHQSSKYTGVETRPGGRKVYYSILGFGEEGTLSVAFSTIGKYDLILTQMISSGGEAKKLQNPARPRKLLQQAFERLEQITPNLARPRLTASTQPTHLLKKSPSS